MLELYHVGPSTCSQKVRLCLAEKQLEWTSRIIDIANWEHLTPAYLKLNPNGVMPTLVDGGRSVIESSVIVEYLEEIAPSSGISLMPPTALGRAQVRAWLRYIDEVPTAAIRIPSFNGLFLKGWQSIGAEKRAEYLAKTPLRKGLYRQFGTKGFSLEMVEDSMARLTQTLERIEKATSRAPWLAGDQFTLADICVTPTVVRLEDLGMTALWTSLPNMADWYRRIQARPSFATAFFPGSRFAPGSEELGGVYGEGAGQPAH